MKCNKILIATSNPGKFQEIRDFLKTLPLELVSLSELQLAADYEESGDTFEENAAGKAKYYSHKSGLPTLAEDSGILVDALRHELGVKTRRWGKGEKASDREWVDYFLEVMRPVPPKQRRASFVCYAALYFGENVGKKPGIDLEPKLEPKIFKGETRGMITGQLEAPIQPGLPLSSCFKPLGSEKVYAALTPEEKSLISHRGKAMEGVRNFLERC